MPIPPSTEASVAELSFPFGKTTGADDDDCDFTHSFAELEPYLCHVATCKLLSSRCALEESLLHWKHRFANCREVET